MKDITKELDKPENLDVVLRSGEVFEAIEKIADGGGLKTLAIIGVSKTGEGENAQISTPVVIDKSKKHELFVLTQDADHVVLTVTQAKNLAALLSEFVGGE